jgi:hypothetical protein
MSAQAHWAQALLDPEHVTPSGLVAWNRSDPVRRLAVYRNNVMVSLVDALAQTFPVTQQLVGEQFFRAMAQMFVREHPPRTRVLSYYGDALPGFIAQFPPAASLPYLADVARLEMLRLQALHAADATPMDAQAITGLLQDAEHLQAVRWHLAPCMRLLRSPHAAVSLWAAHHEDSGLSLDAIDWQQPESALVFRSEWDVMVLQVPTGVVELLALMQQGLAFGEACDLALDAAPELDLALALAAFLRHGLLVGADRPH